MLEKVTPLAATSPGQRMRQGPVQLALSAESLRRLRRRIEQSDLPPDLRQDAVDLVYATVATGLDPADWPHARLEGREHDRIMRCPDQGDERRLEIGRLGPWVLDRVLAVRKAASQSGWSTRVERIEAALSEVDRSRRARAEPTITLQSAMWQYLDDLATRRSTADAAAPKPQSPRGASPSVRSDRRIQAPRLSAQGLFFYRPQDIDSGQVWAQIYQCMADGAVDADQHLAAATRREYRRESERLLRQGTPSAIWATVAATRRPNVAQKRRAALHWRYREEARRLFVAGYQTNWDTQQHAAGLRRWQLLQAVIQQEPPADARLPPPETRRPRKSKRGLLRYLHPGWELALAASVPVEWQDPVLLQAITGCRPSELAAGVQVEVTEDELVVRIQGKKVTASSGWPWRTMVWRAAADGAPWDPLIAAVRLGGTRTVGLPGQRRHYCQIVARTAAKIWPHLPDALTPYVMRHQVASNAKEYWDPETIAHVLGHKSPKTQSTYGLRRYADGAAANRLPDTVTVSADTAGESPEAASEPEIGDGDVPDMGM
jgi:integrase